MNALRRSRSHVVRSGPMRRLTLAALGSMVVACQPSAKAPPGGPLVASPPSSDSLIPGTQIVKPGDCPHDWRPFVGRYRGANAADSNFLAVGARTQVVEWHDCQKFVNESGRAYD